MSQSQSWPGNPTTRVSDGPKKPDYPDKVRVPLQVGGTPMTMEIDLFRYGRDRSPETGELLSELNPQAHVAALYGSAPLPVEPGTLLARMRRAVILGEPLPEY